MNIDSIDKKEMLPAQLRLQRVKTFSVAAQRFQEFSSAFVGHDACSSNSYLNGIVFPNTEYSVHPNADGQTAYKKDLSDAMN